MATEKTLVPKTTHPPMTLRDLREVAKRSAVAFNGAMGKIRAFDYKLASAMVELQRQQDSFGVDAKRPDIAATFEKRRKQTRDKYWTMHEGEVRKHVAELRENATLMKETKRVLANPKAVLSLAEIGSPRRVALLQEMSLMGDAALRNAASVAVSTKDAVLGGVLLTINESKKPQEWFLDQASTFASDIVGDQVAEASNLIRDLEAREVWASENWRSRDRNKPISATARITWSLRFGNEIPKESALTEADLPTAA